MQTNWTLEHKSYLLKIDEEYFDPVDHIPTSNFSKQNFRNSR